MSAPSLRLFSAPDCQQQPRDKRGRFKHVEYSSTRQAILRKAIEIREGLGLPHDGRLVPFNMSPETRDPIA